MARFIHNKGRIRQLTVKNVTSIFLSTALVASNVISPMSMIQATETNQNIDESILEISNKIEANQYFNSNLKNMTFNNGSWNVESDGLHSNAEGQGDCFLFSETKGSNFVYQTDVTFLSEEGAASLIFRNESSDNNSNCYAVNLSASNKNCKFWRWVNGCDSQLINEKSVPASEDGKYTLKVVAIDSWISYYVNDTLVASSGDYTLQKDDRDQDTSLRDGYVGLLNWNGNMVFQNTQLTPIDDSFNPQLDDITIESSTGDVEKKSQFRNDEPITIQYVKNNASTINVNASCKNDKANVTITGPDGNVYEDGKNIPVNVGINYINVVSQITNDDGTSAELTYRVNVHRRQADAVYYNEPYRNQFHYSVKDGWANDPNGLVYFNGQYHLFYQFYDATEWGPMHWAHATSKDLIHWDEEPIAFYPDANGAMFSGCIVADSTNSSGLFSSEIGGLVALITADGNGQRIKLAYSEDEGKTWTKLDKVAADWTRDPLKTDAFRDPKVFRFENKWFMVIAGGPLRIYSSDNLIDWTCESTYPDLHTECPDLYPLNTDEGLKWVLSRGGRFYKIGDFKQVNDKWSFVPDDEYKDTDGIMNFGKDSYAAMTFYVQDFGTNENPTIPDIVEINWMNTWDDYCNKVANKVGQDFNGTFNLPLQLGLVKEGNKYLLTQSPVDELKSLRGDAYIDLKQVNITEDNNLLDGFAMDNYEIVSTFYPTEETKKIGFKLRVGENESTDVIYNLASNKLSIDRSQSGIIISNRFADIDSQSVTRNPDGSIDLHIYVDCASVEVFSKEDTIAGANQIFPKANSLGAQIIVEGGSANADVTIYPLNSIWDKVNTDIPVAMSSSTQASNRMYVGDELTINTSLLPINVDQDVVFNVSDESIASVTSNGSTAVVKGLKKGKVIVTATAKNAPEITKTFEISIVENNFKTNLDDFVSVNGNWIVDDETLSDANICSNDFYMCSNPITTSEYTLETKVQYTKGLVNIFFAGKSTDPFNNQAYAIQIGDSNNLRLFRFASDTIIESDMGKHINDGNYHDIKITKTKDSITVAIDGIDCMSYHFDYVEEFFNTNPYVGIGLWDGEVNAQTFYVNNINDGSSVDTGNKDKDNQSTPDKKPDKNENCNNNNNNIVSKIIVVVDKAINIVKNLFKKIFSFFK